MGDRAVISNKAKNLGVYLHWNGYREFVESVLAYCDLKEYRSPDVDDEYGWARLCQVIGNTIGGTLSLGIGRFERMDTDNWDNGTYIIKGWDIKERLYQHYEDQKRKDPIFNDLVYINDHQPKDERLEEDKLKEYAEKWEETHLDRLDDKDKPEVLKRIQTKEKEAKEKENKVEESNAHYVLIQDDGSTIEVDAPDGKKEIKEETIKISEDSKMKKIKAKKDKICEEPINYKVLIDKGQKIQIKGDEDRGR